MKALNTKRLMIGLGASAVLAAAFLGGRAFAAGIPSDDVLSYSGVLMAADGTVGDSTEDIVIEFAVTAGGTPVCTTTADDTEVTNGRFTVALSPGCVQAVQDNPKLYVQVSAGADDFGWSPIGAVPYAIEASHATTADDATHADAADLLGNIAPSDVQRRNGGAETTCSAAGLAIKTIAPNGNVTCETDDNTTYTGANGLVPTGMIGLFTVTCPTGWTLCNGGGACPNLDGAYIKAGNVYAAPTGQNTHTHPVGTYATSGAGAHAHSGSSITAAGNHSHIARFDWNAGQDFLIGQFANTPTWTGTHQVDVTVTTGTVGTTQTFGIVTTSEPNHTHPLTIAGESNHTHPVTGTSGSSNHEPVHASLILCRKD